MTKTIWKLKTMLLIVGATLVTAACGGAKDDAPAAESSIAEPHGSLSAAANVMSPPAESTATTPPAEQK